MSLESYFSKLVASQRDLIIARQRGDDRIPFSTNAAEAQHSILSQAGPVDGRRIVNEAIARGSYLAEAEEPRKGLT